MSLKPFQKNKKSNTEIPLFGWISFEIKPRKKSKDRGAVMDIVRAVGRIMEELEEDNKIKQWFFLYEGVFLVIRCERCRETTKKDLIKNIKQLTKNFELDVDLNSFKDYQEEKWKFANQATVEAFANIMCWITKLWMAKHSDWNGFSSYRFMERVSHCMFNVFCGGFLYKIKGEKYFLHQRILERGGDIYDDEFEDTNLPDINLNSYG